MTMPKGWKGKKPSESIGDITSNVCVKCRNVCSPYTRFCNICGNFIINNNFIDFELPEKNLKIQYPKNWTVQENFNAPNQFLFRPPESSQDFNRALFVTIQTVVEDPSIKSLVKTIPLIDVIKSTSHNLFAPSFKLIDMKPMTINETSVVQVTAKSNIFMDTRLFFVIDNAYLAIIFSSPIDTYQNNLPIFEYMISSLQLNTDKNLMSSQTKLIGGISENEHRINEDKYNKNNNLLSKEKTLSYFNNPEIEDLVKLSTDETEPNIKLEKAEYYIKNDPSNALAWNLKGIALARLDRSNEAIEAYDHAISLDPNCFMAMSSKAHLLMMMNRDDEGVKLYGKTLEIIDDCLSKAPHDFLSWRTKGEILSELERYDNAIECFDKAISVYANDNYVWSSKAFALSELGKYYDSLTCYEKAIDLDPKDSTSWSNKGFVYGLLEMDDEELKCHDKVLGLNPNNFEAWSNKAFVLERLERFEEALHCLDESIKVEPNYLETRLRKGEILLHLGKYYDAKGEFSHAIRIDSNNANAWYNRGCTEICIGENSEGLSGLIKAIELGGREIKEIAKKDKLLDNIRNDPKFIAIIK